MTLESTLTGGATSRSAEQPVDLTFTEPALFDYAPTDPFLGQIVTIRGGILFVAEDGKEVLKNQLIALPIRNQQVTLTVLGAQLASIDWVTAA